MDALVRKGILTEQEAEDIKSDLAKENRSVNKVTLPGKTTKSLNFSGDFRGRYESFYYDNAAGADRQRFRYRLRFGVTAALTDSFEAGFRLGSGDLDGGISSGLDPISNNQSLQNNGSKKGVFLDLAYGKWTPLRNDNWLGSVMVGKIENPFVFSDMVFDGDYTPEGAALQLNYNLSEQHTVKFNGGAFVLDEIGSQQEDPYLVGTQVRLESVWNKNWSSSVGVGWVAIEHEEGLANTVNGSAAVPNINVGNTRYPFGTTAVGTVTNGLIYNFNPVIADTSVTYTVDKFPLYPGAFPIKLAGDFVHNPNAGTDNNAWSAGLTFGKAGKKGSWEFSYRYKYLEADAWYEELVDSDFGAYYQAAPTGGSAGYGAGTNVKGHVLKTAYSPYDALTLGVTAFFTDLINKSPATSESGTTRIQMDAVLKF
jgi:hypothetical protein